ncbi:hypothetical protein PYW07_001395 [Mythimna separata]|uniref:Ig-like domain-containing protein n=1 Tax=Mythimna separata TaxID=271217 RepID=A0AAD7YT42_MYTSE|nr:hypothetical protein PYW07_001395 [Mythimna separata]
MRGGALPGDVPPWGHTVLTHGVTVHYEATEDPVLALHDKEELRDNLTVSVMSFVPTLDDDGKPITCRAENPNVTTLNMDTSWTINVVYPPVVRLRLGSSLAAGDIKEGDDVYFECHVRANPPARKLSWLHDDRPLAHNATARVFHSNQSLVLQKVTRHSSGRYACSALNAEGETVSNELLFRVKSAAATPAPRSTPRARPSPTSCCSASSVSELHPIHYNQSLVLQKVTRHSSGRYACSALNAEGETVSNELLFRVNISELHPIHYNQSLVLQKVTRHSSGRYACSALNAEGETVSNELLFRVKYSPSCRTGGVAVVGAARGESVVIVCEVDADPPAAVFKWKFNNSGETLDVAADRYTSNGSASSLKYTPVADLDYGTLSCSASNEVGSQLTPCVFQMVAAGKPHAPRNCTLWNQTAESVEVSCVAGFDGGLPQRFLLEVYADSNVPSSAGVVRGGLRRRPAAEVPAGGVRRQQRAQVRQQCRCRARQASTAACRRGSCWRCTPTATCPGEAAVQVSCVAGFDGGLPQRFLLEVYADSNVPSSAGVVRGGLRAACRRGSCWRCTPTATCPGEAAVQVSCAAGFERPAAEVPAGGVRRQQRAQVRQQCRCRARRASSGLPQRFLLEVYADSNVPRCTPTATCPGEAAVQVSCAAGFERPAAEVPAGGVRRQQRAQVRQAVQESYAAGFKRPAAEVPVGGVRRQQRAQVRPAVQVSCAAGFERPAAEVYADSNVRTWRQ